VSATCGIRVEEPKQTKSTPYQLLRELMGLSGSTSMRDERVTKRCRSFGKGEWWRICWTEALKGSPW